MMRQHYYKDNLRFRDKIFALDFTLIFLILLLGVISLFAMYSTEQGNFDYYTKSHVYRFFAFFMLFLGISFFRIQFWYKSAYIFYVLVLLLLIGVDLYGITASGSKRWISLFFINLQPSELMKVSLIVFLARYYNKIPSTNVNNLKYIIIHFLSFMIPVFLVLSHPRNDGSLGNLENHWDNKVLRGSEWPMQKKPTCFLLASLQKPLKPLGKRGSERVRVAHVEKTHANVGK